MRKAMKDLDYYMNIPFRIEITPDTDEGGYAASFPELPGCLTCGDTIESAVRNAEDAKKEWLSAALESGIPIPEPVPADDYSGQFKLRLPKTLHKQLSEQAKAEGISMNQYCIYLLSQNNARHHI